MLDFADEQEAAAVASAFELADVAGETLAVSHVVQAAGAVHTASGEVAQAPEFEAVVAAGTYANSGAITVGVSRVAP